MKPFRIFSVVMLIVVLPSIVDAQDYSCLKNRSMSLDSYIGEWTVDWTFRTSPGIYSVTTGNSTISDALNRCAVREKFRASRPSGAFFHELTIAFLAEEKLAASWLDSEHGNFMYYEDLEASDDWRVRLIWHHSNGRMKTRIRFSPLENNRFTVERHLSTDQGNNWSLTGRLVYSNHRPNS